VPTCEKLSSVEEVGDALLVPTYEKLSSVEEVLMVILANRGQPRPKTGFAPLGKLTQPGAHRY
jgi:hypothetical protein